MHSYEGPSGRTYHHEAEGSVNDVIHFSVDYTVERVSGPRVHQVEVTIPMEDLMFLVGNLVRSQKIGFYEEASDADVLGLKES